MRAPPLETQNRFEGLSVQDTDNSSDDSETIVATPSNNGKGSPLVELGAPDACLIPCLNKKPIIDKPKEGVPKKDERFFIRSMRMEKEVFLNVTITTMDTHD